MPDVNDEIDEMVRTAARAHEALAGADYFDGLAARVLTRLESRQDEVSMMSDTPSKDVHGSNPIGGVAGAGGGNTEDSGLHDMKALAQTAKQRISRRITSQHDAYDESLLSSTSSGLRAVALPVQAQVVSLPELPRTAAAAEIEARTGHDIDGATVTPITAAKRSKAIWFIGGGLLAAAAVAAFVVVGGGNKKEASQDKVATAAGEAAGTSAATGAPAMTGMPAPATVVVPAEPSAAAATGGESGTAAVTAPAAEEAAKVAVADDKAKLERGTEKRVAAGSGSAAKQDGTAADKAAPKGGKPDDKKPGGGDKPAGGDKAGGGAAPAGGGAGGKDQSIEALLNEASGGAQKPTEGGGDSGGGGGGGDAKPDKTSLDGKDIKAGMSGVAGKAQACYDQHGVAGHVKIKATVDPSGKVTKADATGEFAGTPTGSCVAAAVKSASFATWSGAPMTVSYGFTLVE